MCEHNDVDESRLYEHNDVVESRSYELIMSIMNR